MKRMQFCSRLLFTGALLAAGYAQAAAVPCPAPDSIINRADIIRFDIADFNQHKNGGDNYTVVLADGTTAYRFATKNHYIEHRATGASPCVTITMYDKQGTLSRRMQTFHSMEVGRIAHFDAAGHVVRTEDLDAPFGLSIPALAALMNDKFAVDIMAYRGVFSLSRFIADTPPHPYYKIRYPDKQEHGALQEMLLDGNTGAVLKTQRRVINDRVTKDVWLKYKASRQ